MYLCTYNSCKPRLHLVFVRARHILLVHPKQSCSQSMARGGRSREASPIIRVDSCYPWMGSLRDCFARNDGYQNYAWAQSLMNGMGGIETVQTMHHIFAYMMGIETVYHVFALFRSIFIKKSPNRFSMIPGLKDITDALRHLGYNLGLVKDLPKYGRFNWKEKGEYWALIGGTIVMFLTGAFLMWPEIITRWLPGYYPGGQGGPRRRSPAGVPCHPHLAHVQRPPGAGQNAAGYYHLHGQGKRGTHAPRVSAGVRAYPGPREEGTLAEVGLVSGPRRSENGGDAHRPRFFVWGERRDSNPRSSDPQSDALTARLRSPCSRILA